MLLQNKNAVVYGAGGSLGGAIAKAFAGAGAKVYLTGHNLRSVQKVTDEILAAGGNAEADRVDAMDESAIGSHINRVVNEAGTVDISFNAISLKDVQNIPLVDMDVKDFIRPVSIAMQTHFLTATAAARIMIKQGSGVILSLTATPAVVAYPLTGGFGTAGSAMENFYRLLAAELGVYGVRAVNIRSGGSTDSKVFAEAMARDPEGMAPLRKKMEDDTMLKELPVMADIANAAVFLSSGLASKITGVTIDITCGTTSGLNYRMVPVTLR